MSATASPEVFTRKASGLVRVMSPYSAFMYNILTMGLIFPWTYLWAPGALPGGHLVWGIILATIVEIPIALVYVWLSTALPRSGGDYVFQSRVFGGGTGFTVVMSGFIIWVLQWVALSGWLLAYLGFAPLLLGLGATLHDPGLTAGGIWCTTPTGIITISIINAFASLVLLISGFKSYVRLQYIMFYAMMLSFAVMVITFLRCNPAAFPGLFDSFVVNSGGAPGFYAAAVAGAAKAGINLSPPPSLWATLLVAPIAWTSLQWAPYSVLQNGEIKGARSFSNQLIIIIGSLLITGFLLALLAYVFEHAVGYNFLNIAGAGYWAGLTQGTFNGVYLWPSIVAMAISGSPIVVVLISFGYILNSFQIVNNSYIGMTRAIMAMSLDRLLPESLSRVSAKFHTPVTAHVVYFLASIPVIFLYNGWAKWAALTLGVTFACGYVFVITCFAGALLPYRAKALYEASPGAQYKIFGLPAITVLGLLGTVLGGGMVLMFAFSSAYGLNTALAREAVLGVLIFSFLLYLVMKFYQKSRGIDVTFAFREIPPE
jgi:amino acid transporter